MVFAFSGFDFRRLLVYLTDMPSKSPRRSVSLSRPVYEALKAHCHAHERSMSSLVEQLIMSHNPEAPAVPAVPSPSLPSPTKSDVPRPVGNVKAF